MQNDFLVLVVDDVPANLLAIEGVLDIEGIRTQSATSGRESLELVNREKPDLILLDIQMPGMDGFEVCKILKSNEKTADIPVIFLTASNALQDIIKGFDLGATDYVTKPFQPSELVARVNNHLQLQRARNEIGEKNYQLEDQNKKLKELIATRDHLFSIIAHDLRSPIGTLIQMLDYMVENYHEFSPAMLKESLINLRNSVGSSFGLLENLLNWAQSHRGHLHYNPVMTDLRDLTGKTIDLYQPAANKKGLAFHNLIEGPLMAYCDREMIRTVIRNLLNNAVKYTRSGGTITIRGKENDPPGSVEISIQDTGVGIKPENIAKLFRTDTFFTTYGTSHEKGSGLGLVLCQEFIIRNKGEIKVKSEVGIGSTFIITLPSGNSGDHPAK